jgi:hypothetical protein
MPTRCEECPCFQAATGECAAARLLGAEDTTPDQTDPPPDSCPARTSGGLVVLVT